jgi:hypothetical protein
VSHHAHHLLKQLKLLLPASCRNMDAAAAAGGWLLCTGWARQQSCVVLLGFFEKLLCWLAAKQRPQLLQH